jgi:hypothetical protein
VTGKKIIHTETKSWHVPYCTHCLDHIQVAKELRKFSMFVLHPSVPIGLVGGVLAFCAFGMACSLSQLLGVLVGFLVVVATVGILMLTFPACQAKYHRDVAAKNAQKAQLEEELNSLLCRTCAEEDCLAAGYHGWQGTVHTFSFSSGQFTRNFERCNRGKCLGDGQIHH